MREETSCILSKIVVSWITISELFREGGLWNKICCRAEGRCWKKTPPESRELTRKTGMGLSIT